MSQFDSYDEVEMCDYEENVTSTLFLFYLDGEYIGYVIVDKETNNICEISENVPTYYLYMSNNGYSKLNPSGWERMVSEVEVLFNKNYANNSVPSVIKEYVKNTVGHMTMCCGYVRQGSNSYMMALADGHSSSIVYKRWSNDYNDCIITAKIY